MNRASITLSLAVAATLLLAGCGDLVTSYATVGEGSVNGVQVMHTLWQERFTPASLSRLSDRAAQRDLLIHVARGPLLPDAEACAWITAWLEEDSGRQFVLVLRDGAVGAWLCRRWADEAEAEAGRLDVDSARAAELRETTTRLRARAAAETIDETASGERTCDLFTAHRGGATAARTVSGLVSTAAPEPMRSGARIDARLAESLVAIDDLPWAVSIPMGNSRLIVVADATPLLDGALVDAHARPLLAALGDEIASWSPQRGAWLGGLGVRQGEPDPPNILAMLFGKPPFSYAAFHLLAVVLTFILWKAAWIGRVQAPRDHRVERFSRHVSALAWHLRRGRGRIAAVEAIARHLDRAAGSTPRSDDEALARVQELYRGEVAAGAPRPTPASPAPAAPAAATPEGPR